MIIQGFSKTSLLDYPGHIAADVFTAGCNFRCPFCHNSDLVLTPATEYSEEEVLSVLKKRRGILEGVCITGGEPTLQPDLLDFMHKLRELDYKIKLDTNGYHPEVLRAVLLEGLADYVAIDIKNSLAKYPLTAGISDFCQENIKESISLLMNSDIDYEFRTTVVRELHTAEDLTDIAHMLGGCKQYFLQSFKDSGNVISDGFSAYTDDEMITLYNTIKLILPVTKLRGIDIERNL
ncbi:MAG: anaerobic ribonucleoside-triphosphate reductase activating protein [Lachnospiraceae bacterium]|nr:anaerobic ribonucleoside-triphosphate reductase activating protein [Lachnospiraceae bacterium]